VGERGVISRYAYWSERRIRDIASENDVSLDRRGRMTIKLPAIPFFPSFEFAQEARTLRKAEVARRVEEAIGIHAVEDFVTPPPVRFAKGVGQVSFSQFSGVTKKPAGVVVHTRTRSSAGVRVEVCLFGSLDNTASYVGGADEPDGGWSSSAAQSIERFLRSRGTVNNSQWDDPESISVEALKICLHQGETGKHEEHEGKPWTRGFTLSHADESEWFAEIYSDVVLDKDRWNGYDDVDRILIGAPLWVRTPSPEAVTRYRDLRRAGR